MAFTFFLAELITSYIKASRRGHDRVTPGQGAKMSHHEAKLARAIRNTLRRYEETGDLDKMMMVVKFREILRLLEVDR